MKPCLAEDASTISGKRFADYVERIELCSESTLKLYRDRQTEEAKREWERAYFENFEYLEGPIRRNISAKRNAELEYEFGDIRKMIKRKEPYSVVERSVKELLEELRKTLPELETDANRVAAIDTSTAPNLTDNAGRVNLSWAQVAKDIENKVGNVIKNYTGGNGKDSADSVQDIYFDVFEDSGMEAGIGARDPEFKAKLEGDFNKIVAQMKKAETKGEIEKSFTVMQQDLDIAVRSFEKKSETPLITLFFYSFLIVLREGFEAILIICAIIAYLLKTGHKDKVKTIYNGCFIAIALSFVTALLVKWVFWVNAANQEILEGITMLMAAAVLFFVSFWLISKVEAHKWMNYIKSKVDRSLTAGSMFALWFAAFLAVYREGAETVLFYQALGSGSEALDKGIILGGFIVGCIALIAVFIGVRFGSARLPLKPFFIATSALLYYMAFVFAGKGVMEFIEGKLIEPSLIANGPNLPFLGIYPYWQTILPQGLLIIAALAGLYITFAKKGG